MSTTVALTGSYTVQWLIESRPPSVSWSRPAPPQPNQPPLDLIAHESDAAEIVAPRDGGARITTVTARWAARPRPGLPDAQQWSAALALAVVQALLGHRDVAQAILSKRALAIDQIVSGDKSQEVLAEASSSASGRTTVAFTGQWLRTVVIPRARRSGSKRRLNELLGQEASDRRRDRGGHEFRALLAGAREKQV
jgi:hypothetical protein